MDDNPAAQPNPPASEPGQSASGLGSQQPQQSRGLLLASLKFAWAFPVTLIGLIAVAVTKITGGSVRFVAGAIEAGGGFSAWVIRNLLRGRVTAMTLGHVILGVDDERLCLARQHEHIHIRQYERWGLLFIPLYAASSIIAWARGRHFYRDNVFEREAYAASQTSMRIGGRERATRQSMAQNGREYRKET
jgi:hypothetical protein